MAAKKIRCICGKIYEPAIHPACPDCQAPHPGSKPLSPAPASPPALPVAQEPLPLVPPEKQTMLDSDRTKRPWNYLPAPVPARGKLILCAILAGLLVGGWLILRPPRKAPEPTPKPTEKASSTATLATPNPTPVPIKDPVPTPQKDPAPVVLKDLAPISPKDLAAEIAKAKPGATLKLAAGTYRSGFTIDRPIHLIGDSTGGPVIIHNDDAGPLIIKAPGVVMENLRFTGQSKDLAALMNVIDKAEIDVRQCLFDTTGSHGLVGEATAKITASRCTFSTNTQGTGLQLAGTSRAEVSDCLFKGNRWGCGFREAAQGRVKGCRFEQNGLPDKSGYSLGVSGEKTYAIAEQCTFTENQRGVVANDGGHLSLKGCIFKNNGVTDAPTHLSFGTLNASSRAQVLASECTFDSNRQGLVVQSGGSAKVDNSLFTNTGLRVAHANLAFFCNSVSATGEGSKVTLYKTNIRQALQIGVRVIEGAALEMEDCEVSGGLGSGLWVGMVEKMRSEAKVVNCRFLEHKMDGIYIWRDGVVTISKSTLSHNLSDGIEIAGDKATIAAEGCAITHNGQCGILSLQKAFSVLDGCTVQGNRYGVQNGLPKAKDGSGLFLNNCTVSDNTEFGVGALDGSLTLDDCTVTKNKRNFYKTGGLILETSNGKKPLPSEQRTGVEPTGQTGGKTGVEDTTPVGGSADNGADSTPQKKPASTKRKPTPPPVINKAEEIIRDVIRYIPR